MKQADQASFLFSLLPIWAALFGAMAGGGVRLWVDWIDRRKQAQTLLVAIASEVDAICRLIRFRDYRGVVDRALVQAARTGKCGSPPLIDIRSDYFTIFTQNATNVGRLKPEQAFLVVNFYSYCKSMIDTTRRDGPLATDAPNDVMVIKLRALGKLFDLILALGDRILELPAKPLPEIDNSLLLVDREGDATISQNGAAA